uniref:Beta-amylase n=1 Tax=Kalanchoe fedtschenkoi TaxID=63787 RepID=A0A7N0T2L9_KALFE
MVTEMQKMLCLSEDDDEEDDMGVKEEGNEESRNNAMMMGGGGDGMGNSHFQHHPQEQSSSQGGSRRRRPLEEKERTKLRERHRRAITARLLAGLRRHGNYNLRVRADINDVIAAVAREAGWTVLPDGTTFPARSQAPRPLNGAPNTITTSSPSVTMQPIPASSLRGESPSYPNSADYNACRLKGVYMSSDMPYDLSSNEMSHTSLVGDGCGQTGDLPLIDGSMGSIDKQIIEMPTRLQERGFAGTSYIPVYVMLPLGVINLKCEIVDPDGLVRQLRLLKSADVDGVMVECWWGIVEAHAPLDYNWNDYKKLFQIVRELKLKLQVVMSFHECGGNVGDDVCIPLPHWVVEVGRSNPDIFFTDREGRRNPECLTWGIDKQRVLKGRTAIEVYFDFMKSFRVEFHQFFEDGCISMIQVGLGPCGHLRYPSYPIKHGWRYPGAGQFQCYDQYLLKNLATAAEARGHSFWGRAPDNAGSYNSRPFETGFFCDGGDYDGYHGRFFLSWYSQVLVDHGDQVLSLAKLAFEGTPIAAKLPGIHWWYKTVSHAAELTAGFHNPSNRDGYAPIVAMLKKHGAIVNFTCVEVPVFSEHEEVSEAFADSDGLVWQVMNAAWDAGIPVGSENCLPCYDGEAYNKILDIAKPFNNPDGQHLCTFNYIRLSLHLMEQNNLMEFDRFVKKMHGETTLNHQIR